MNPPRVVACTGCGRKVTTCLDAPDDWRGGFCRRCLVLAAILAGAPCP